MTAVIGRRTHGRQPVAACMRHDPLTGAVPVACGRVVPAAQLAAVAMRPAACAGAQRPPRAVRPAPCHPWPTVFQQLEVDYTVGRPRQDVWATQATQVPVVRMYGVNDAGAGWQEASASRAALPGRSGR